MQITAVDIFRVQASQQTPYWGDKAWGKSAPSLTRRRDSNSDFSVEYPLRWRIRHGWEQDITSTIVKVTTDTGIIGYGEAKGPVVSEVPVAIVRGLLSDVLLRADPFDIKVIWDRMYARMRGRGHFQGFLQEAMSGLDIALWDTVGRATDKPIYKLLGGGYRDTVRVYASGIAGLSSLENGEEQQRLEKDAMEQIEKGFRGVKIATGFGVEADIASVETVRKVIGPDKLILVDALGSYDLTIALQLGEELQQLGVGWLETPLPPEDVDGYVELSRRLKVHVSNDFTWTRWGVKDMLMKGGRVIPIPEVLKAGGITECYRIAELADTFGVGFASHVSIGTAIQFAATAQLAAAVPNFMISEYWVGNLTSPLGDDILEEPLLLEGGRLQVPQGPGLGVEIDEEALEKHRVSECP